MTSPVRLLGMMGMGVLWLTMNATQAAPTAYEAALAANNPYALYHFTDSGSILTDSSGNAHNGAYFGSPTLGTTGYGGGSDTATYFNANSQYASLTGANSFGSSLGSSTIAFLLSTNSSALGVLLGETQNATNDAFSITLNSNSSGTLSAGTTRIFIRADTLADTFSATFTNAALYSGNFVDLTFTFDLTSSTPVTVYVNGVAQTLGSVTNKLTSADTFSALGNSFFVAAADVRGSTTAANLAASAVTIDELALYSTVLTATQVQANVATLSAVPEPSPLALAGFGVLAFACAAAARRSARPRHQEIA
ncbi:LamG-like jellyroll fold domain-containing protein [Verrucomicrobium sp. GAS474]|uniref:LamG-like jellyroll fold domain-containing protein n=1 Tax=Verrucomicrobium sp. GAS474 TaxID=1882831 RepID=UPI0012FF64D1|nr:LamG-like jellyroll fold domain-containing protein [Verrucomicrobium sp. GAS474]